jgi:enoyl-CoA hydratase/carnithine racemase
MQGCLFLNNVIIGKEGGNICSLTLNRPGKLNALNRDMLMLIGDAVNEAASDGDVRVLIIKGHDTRAFSSGGDLTQPDGEKNFSLIVEAIQYFQQSMLNYPLPIIAMICGPAIGLGLHMATMCDIRLAGDNAYFSANTVRLGKVYHHTSTRRLIDIVGCAAATELLITGRIMDVWRAERVGLVNQVYTVDQLEEKTYELAREIVEKTAPEAVRDTKAMLKRLIRNETGDSA